MALSPTMLKWITERVAEARAILASAVTTSSQKTVARLVLLTWDARYMAIVFDPTLGYSVRETWEEAQKNPGAALDRCEIVLARQGMGPAKRKRWEKLALGGYPTLRRDVQPPCDTEA